MKKMLMILGLAVVLVSLVALSVAQNNKVVLKKAADEKVIQKPVMPIKEDCVGFNPATVTASKVSGNWKVVDGNHWMFDFGANKAGAEKAVEIIKHYKMNKSCFVGRPDPKFKYMLINQTGPAGSTAGEDCLSFNPANAKVTNVNGSWKIVDGNHWMFDFGAKKNEADLAMAIIHKYGFNQTCYVARPNPPFAYLRK